MTLTTGASVKCWSERIGDIPTSLYLPGCYGHKSYFHQHRSSRRETALVQEKAQDPRCVSGCLSCVRTHYLKLTLTGCTAPILLKPEDRETDELSPHRADSESDLDLRPTVTEPARKSPPSITGADKSLHLVKTDSPRRGITFAPDVHRPPDSKPLYIPGPRDRDNGMPTWYRSRFPSPSINASLYIKLTIIWQAILLSSEMSETKQMVSEIRSQWSCHRTQSSGSYLWHKSASRCRRCRCCGPKSQRTQDGHC